MRCFLRTCGCSHTCIRVGGRAGVCARPHVCVRAVLDRARLVGIQGFEELFDVLVAHVHTQRRQRLAELAPEQGACEPQVLTARR